MLREESAIDQALNDCTRIPLNKDTLKDCQQAQ